MECNRDEAIRARDIAEKKFAMEDYVGAKKFIFKAQQLYAPIEGATQMLAVLDVHIAAQVKVGANETDWYGILQVEPVSDDSTIKKQYRRLALLLHPDKNKSIGAEAAFKLIGEAFGILSDKGKRFVHDSKRAGEAKVPQMTSQASEPPKSSYSAYQAQYQAAAQATAGAGAQATAPHASLTFWTSCPLCRMQYQYLRTYLNYQLLCQKCNKPFLAKDINAPTANGSSTFPWPRGSFEQNGPLPGGPVHSAPKKAGFNFQTWSRSNNEAAPDNGAGNGHTHGPGEAHPAGVGNRAAGGSAGAGASATAAAAAAASLVQEAYRRAQKERVDAEKEMKRREKEKDKLSRLQEKEALRKVREEVKAKEAIERLMNKRKEATDKAALRERGRRPPRKRRRRDESDEEDEDDDDEILERFNLGRRSSRQTRKVPYGLDGSDDDDDDDDFEATTAGAKTFRTTANGGDRVEKGKSVVIDDGVGEGWIKSGDGGGGLAKDRSGGSAFAAERAKGPLQELLAERFRRELASKMGVNNSNRDFTQGSEGKMEEDAKLAGGSSLGNGKGDHNNETGSNSSSSPGAVEEAIVVPDPDFHDFDADRTELHVKKSQVWAVYDETDGMPRFYCLVNKVSQVPFLVEGLWLESIHQHEDGFDWLNKRELSISTGEFKLGDEISFDQINMFSHLMPVKRYKTALEVYPKRSEVWAVYKDYDDDQPSSDADGRVQFRYDFVEIRSDFALITAAGRVVKLKKLAGFKTLWVPEGEDYQLTVRYDLHKFSHRVPALLVTEDNIPGVPAGCLELDPASTPTDAIET